MKFFGIEIGKKETVLPSAVQTNMRASQVVQLSKYELPTIVENRNEDWVQLGNNHSYTQKLSELYKSCAIHGSVIRKKQLMITGKGWRIDNQSLNDFTIDSNVAEAVKVNEFFKNASGDTDLFEVLSRIALDYEIYGAFALEIIYTNDLEDIACINHFPVKNVCPGKKNEDGKVENYYWSKDWTNRKVKPECIPSYDVKNPAPRQLLYVYKYDGDLDYFGTPRYVAAVVDIEARAEMSLFQANNVREGFAPSMVIKYYQEPKTQLEADNIARGLTKSFQGPKGKKLMVMFGNGKDLTPDVTPVAAQNVDKQFTQLVSDTSESICSAHGVTSPLLMGISVPGKLGGDSSLAESYEIFYNDEILPTQELILKVFTSLARKNGITNTLTIERSTPILTKPV